MNASEHVAAVLKKGPKNIEKQKGSDDLKVFRKDAAYKGRNTKMNLATQWSVTKNDSIVFASLMTLLGNHEQ